MSTKSIKHATLIGHIGRSYDHDIDAPPVDPSSQSHNSGFGNNLLSLNEHSDRYKESKWCYDSPGVFHQDQVNSFKSFLLNSFLIKF